jgi:hypothetical protein
MVAAGTPSDPRPLSHRRPTSGAGEPVLLDEVVAQVQRRDAVPPVHGPPQRSPARPAASAMESGRDDVAFPWPTTALTRALRILPKPLATRIMLRFVPAGRLDR